MAINPNLVGVPAQSKNLDTATTTTTAGLVHRQVISLADPETATNYARVSGGSLQVNVQNASIAVTAASLPLPTGASTATLQTTGNTSLNSIDTKTPALSGGRVPVESNLVQGLTDIQLRASAVPISASALPLPTGAATEAKQDTGNTSLSNINTKLPNQLSGAIPVSARDYHQDVARGLVENESVVVIKGYNAATSTTNEPIWAQSGTTYPQVTSAQTLTISSSSLNDAIAGTGAQIVQVKYIKFSDLTEVTASVNMNGMSAVTVSADCYAVNDIRVVQVGSGLSNAGTIYAGYGTVTSGVPANILSTVVAGSNTAQQAIYTVPSGKTLELASFRFLPSVLSIIQFRLKPSKLSAMLITEYDIPLAQAVSFQLPYPILVTSGYQIQMWARTTTGSGLAGVIIHCDLRG